MPTIEVVVHALNVRDGAGVGYNASSALFKGDQATVDTFAPGMPWLHVTAPHVGYIASLGNQGQPTIELLDIALPAPAPIPSSDTELVRTTDSVHVRSGPGTSNPIVTTLGPNVTITVYAHIAQKADGYTWYQLATSDQRWIAALYTVPVIAGVPTSPPTPAPQPVPLPPAPPPIGAWSPPLNAALYGGHSNPGGWIPGTSELDVFRRNHINYALIPAFEANQQGAIQALQSVGVQHFIIRACVNGGANASDFARITLPILQQYAQALGGTNGMMIQLGNEVNLVAEGWTKYWQTGRDFSIWWLNVAGVYRANLPGCKIAFAPMSPGGNAPGIRMDEQEFVAGCSAAIASADFVIVHNYWALPDGSDLKVPVAMWRQQFGSKALVIGESGPPIGSPNVTVEAVHHAHALYSAASLPATFFIMDSSGTSDFNNAGWLQMGITV